MAAGKVKVPLGQELSPEQLQPMLPIQVHTGSAKKIQ